MKLMICKAFEGLLMCVCVASCLRLALRQAGFERRVSTNVHLFPVLAGSCGRFV